MNKNVVYIYFLVVVVLEVVGLLILPENIVMQINSQGEANWSMSKYLGIALLFILSLAGGISVLKSSDNSKKGYMILAVILLVHFVIYFFN